MTLMNTHNVMDMIEVYDLPLDTSVGAIQLYNERARAGKYDYGAVLRSLIGIDCQELEDPDHARVQVGYVIQLAINAHVAGEKIDPNKLYVEATAKARDFARDMGWAFAKKEEEIKLDASGKPKPKKGSKGERSYEVYREMVSKDATRKEIIEAFQSEEIMGMTPHTKSGATTYFYNMKRKYESDNIS